MFGAPRPGLNSTRAFHVHAIAIKTRRNLCALHARTRGDQRAKTCVGRIFHHVRCRHDGNLARTIDFDFNDMEHVLRVHPTVLA